jgi:hypothetical protein
MLPIEGVAGNYCTSAGRHEGGVFPAICEGGSKTPRIA